MLNCANSRYVIVMFVFIAWIWKIFAENVMKMFLYWSPISELFERMWTGFQLHFPHEQIQLMHYLLLLLIKNNMEFRHCQKVCVFFILFSVFSKNFSENIFSFYYTESVKPSTKANLNQATMDDMHAELLQKYNSPNRGLKPMLQREIHISKDTRRIQS